MGCGGDGGRDRAGQAGLNDAENEMLITGGDFHRGFSRKSEGGAMPGRSGTIKPVAVAR